VHHGPVGGEVESVRADRHTLSVPGVGDGADRVRVQTARNERATYPIEQLPMCLSGKLEAVKQVREDDVDGSLPQFGEEAKGFPLHRVHPGPTGDHGADPRDVDADDRKSPSAERAKVAPVSRAQLDPSFSPRESSRERKEPLEERTHPGAEEACVGAIPGIPVASLSSVRVGRSSASGGGTAGRGHARGIGGPT